MVARGLAACTCCCSILTLMLLCFGVAFTRNWTMDGLRNGGPWEYSSTTGYKYRDFTPTATGLNMYLSEAGYLDCGALYDRYIANDTFALCKGVTTLGNHSINRYPNKDGFIYPNRKKGAKLCDARSPERVTGELSAGSPPRTRGAWWVEDPIDRKMGNYYYRAERREREAMYVVLSFCLCQPKKTQLFYLTRSLLTLTHTSFFFIYYYFFYLLSHTLSHSNSHTVRFHLLFPFNWCRYAQCLRSKVVPFAGLVWCVFYLVAIAFASVIFVISPRPHRSLVLVACVVLLLVSLLLVHVQNYNNILYRRNDFKDCSTSALSKASYYGTLPPSEYVENLFLLLKVLLGSSFFSSCFVKI